MPEAEMKIQHLMRLTVNLKNPWKIRNNYHKFSEASLILEFWQETWTRWVGFFNVGVQRLSILPHIYGGAF